MSDDGLFPEPPPKSDLIKPYVPAPEVLARRSDLYTSKLAAEKLTSKTTMMVRLLQVFSNYPTGTTGELAATHAGYGPADGPWKRVSDLLNGELLEDTGTTMTGGSGRQVRVLRITPKGTAWLRQERPR
jgi:hypothetical protein